MTHTRDKLVACGKFDCAPRRVTREGADHTGVDLFIRCAECRREGPYIEIVSGPSTAEQRTIVAAAWNDDLRTRTTGASK